jgi:hypothetical protein
VTSSYTAACTTVVPAATSCHLLPWQCHAACNMLLSFPYNVQKPADVEHAYQTDGTSTGSGDCEHHDQM